jgi:putative peptidoglycan lipid II flippase
MSEITETPPVRVLSGGGIMRAAGLVVIGFILSRILGLVREQIIAAIFGQVDVFAAASLPPETVFYVIAGGALGSAFIPTFVAYMAKDERDEAWRMASIVTNLVTLVLIVICVLGGIFATQLVEYVLAPEFDATKVVETAALMRIMLITPVVFGISGLLMAILNAQQRFLLPALAPSLYNLGIIFGAVALSPFMGVYGLAWGTVIGALLHMGVQIPGLLQLRPTYSPALNANHPGVREILRLMAPRVLGLAIVQINFWVVIVLASGMVEGSITALRRGFYLLLLPQGVIAQSIAIAVFPTFAMQVAQEDRDGLRSTLSQVLRSVLFLALPATVGLVMLRLPIVRVIFERGEFTFEDSQSVAWALLFYGLGLVSHSLLEIVTRAYYAMHDTRTPVYAGGGAMLLNIVFSLLLMRVVGEPGSLEMGPFGGLALALTLATTLEVGLLLVLLRPRIGGLNASMLWGGVIRTGAASLGMGLALYGLQFLMAGVNPYLGLAAALLIGGGLYWGLSWLLGSEDARLFTGIVIKRLRSRTN